MRLRSFALGWPLLSSLAGCGGRDTEAALFDMELVAEDVPASRTNAFADDEAAAAFGRRLFFDERMSRTGDVACASCHDPAEGFSDPNARSEGVDGQLGGRHSMPVTSAAFQSFFLWDGRADSMWLQPLLAIENPKEMDFTRSEVAHFVSSTHAAEYEAIFGPLPDLSTVPARASVDSPEWSAMTDTQRDAVQRVFTNVGKAIEAYERRLLCADTRFDQWVRGELELDADERDGADVFVQEGCVDCHAGPAFSDGLFHNLGLSEDIDDVGRSSGIASLLANPLNGAGSYSDDAAFGQSKLAALAGEQRTQGSFRTASLRGAGQREFFGHTGEHRTLQAFIEATYRGGGGGGGGRRNGNGNGNGNGPGDGDGNGTLVGSLDPLLGGVNPNGGEIDDLVAFIHTLDCPAPPEELLAPP